MTEAIIQVEGLGKRYTLGARASAAGEGGARYRTLRESLSDGTRRLLRRGGNGAGNGTSTAASTADATDFWALKDVSFSVAPGEVVGIIGRNGAGKSTLLKILSRITEPTEGRIKIKGRVASLLEVGTGFHPELTGRENIFLNGAILGMGRAEIKAKFDEIVAFAEVEKFLDTPVKRYSSGMYVRLAFSVAAHLEPEILIVDEVLAVGDSGFQKKCLGKMESVSKREGRTVLFVSHSMSAVARLCSRALFLEGGLLRLNASTSEVVSAYLTSGEGLTSRREWNQNQPGGIPGSTVARLRSASVRNQQGPLEMDSVLVNQEVGVEIEFEVLRPDTVLVPNFHFFNGEGTCLFVTHDWETGWHRRPRSLGRHISTVWVPGNFLNEGSVIVGVALSSYDPFEVHFYERDAVAFHVNDSLEEKTARGDYTGHIPGAVRPVLAWTNALLDGDNQNDLVFSPTRRPVHPESISRV